MTPTARVRLACVGVVFTIWACGTDNRRARGVAAFNRGYERYQRGDFAAADQAFDAATSLLEGRDRAKAFYNRGTTLAREDRLTEAVNAFRSSLSLAPDDENARFNCALVESWLARRTPPSGGGATARALSREEAEAVLKALATGSPAGRSSRPRAQDW